MNSLITDDAEPLDTWRFIVEPDDEGTRLDHFLRDRDFSLETELGMSRSKIQKLIESGFVELDGETSRPAKKLRAGQTVILSVPPPEPLSVCPEDIPIDVRYEDDWLVVVNKHQGLVVHPAVGHPNGTLVNALLFRHGLSGGAPLRPGIVHRLDKDTTGLMVIAKREDAHASLAVQFHEHTVDRRYRVLVSGNPPDRGIWQTLHGRMKNDRKKFSSKVSGGRQAVSEFEVRERFKDAAELSVKLRTGRTHQVRVHCFDHGFPLLGDRLYTPRRLNQNLQKIHLSLPGQALHAELLGFDHPDGRGRMRFEASPPSAYLSALDALKFQQ
jgi:23S rRNA pseudouridine1911/1915/1917 synthase